jgi:hypothetical protein
MGKNPRTTLDCPWQLGYGVFFSVVKNRWCDQLNGKIILKGV